MDHQPAASGEPAAHADVKRRFEDKVAARGRMNYGAALIIAAIGLIFALHPVFLPDDLREAAVLIPMAKDDLETRQKMWIAAVAVLSPVIAFLVKLASDLGNRDRRSFEAKASDPKYADLLIEAQKEADDVRRETSKAEDIRRGLGLAQSPSMASPTAGTSTTTPPDDPLSGHTGRSAKPRPRQPVNTGSIASAIVGGIAGSFVILLGIAGVVVETNTYGVMAAWPPAVMALAGVLVLPPVTRLLRSALPLMRPVWVPPLVGAVVFMAGGLGLGIARAAIH